MEKKSWREIIKDENYIDHGEYTLEDLHKFLTSIFNKRNSKLVKDKSIKSNPPTIEVSIWKDEEQWNESYKMSGRTSLLTGRGGFEYYWNILDDFIKDVVKFTLNGKPIEKELLFGIIKFEEGICKCKCHNKGMKMTHIQPCCKFTYEKYINDDLSIDWETYVKLSENEQEI